MTCSAYLSWRLAFNDCLRVDVSSQVGSRSNSVTLGVVAGVRYQTVSGF